MFARVKYIRYSEISDVPVDFLKDFNVESFSKRRAYWCFWSGTKEISTPKDMLRKVPTIPKYDENMVPSIEVDQSFSGTGYHKATVLAVESKYIPIAGSDSMRFQKLFP